MQQIKGIKDLENINCEILIMNPKKQSEVKGEVINQIKEKWNKVKFNKKQIVNRLKESGKIVK